ncbi:SAM-dependent methyltransferase [Chondromyces apiculatus]|uniref:S-adenosyl methyltransferase n=1 Tax=Chondromyces apiculatus DSM 436 TaxID=1192034 RepID=A0A017T531_9BACT|nr:SAM-dependent methyltransferase [Chondromyces apiculatus]EYF03661.1 Hypothetical protein CAP_5272 [Chondromyces apiculatus DSM 436]
MTSSSHPVANPQFPNAARLYDYVLGGTRNFEPDRLAAQQMAKLLPSMPKWIRMLRASLQQFAVRLADEGFTHFIDFGSGLPTEDHIHASAPNARVIYSDKDPDTVAQAHTLLAGNPKVLYLQSDVFDAKTMLASEAVQQFLGGERRVAFGASGLAVFMSEEQLRTFCRDLYDWAAPGSKLFFTYETKDPAKTTPAWEQFVGAFHAMGEPFRLFSLEEYLAMTPPWTVDAHGAMPLAEFLGHPADYMTDADREGLGLEFYAVILEKK